MRPQKKREYQAEYGTIHLTGDFDTYIENPDTVAYVTVLDKVITIFFKNSVYWEKNMSLIAFEIQCDPTKFFRPRNNWCVNMNYVETFRYQGRRLKILLKNGEWWDVAVLRKGDFIKLYRSCNPGT